MQSSLRKFILLTRTPKLQVALFLTIIALSAVLYAGQSFAFISILASVVAALIIDYFLIRFRKIEPFLLSAALVTGLIIGLLSFPGLPLYYPILAALFALAAKNFIKANNRHIFNPAALGLFVVGLFFHQNISWWGVIFQQPVLTPIALLLIFILLSPGYVSFYRLKKYRTVLSFLIVFFLLQYGFRFFTDRPNLLTVTSNIFLNPLVLFFSLVMLPEPMTSPNNGRLQILFGAFVALAAVLINFVPVFIPDPLIFALLLGNLVFYKLRQIYP